MPNAMRPLIEPLQSILSIEDFSWLDVLDVLLVAVLLYAIITLLRRTRGAPVAIGIVAFLVIWRGATALQLQTLGTMLDVAVTALPFVVVLLFQNTIRRALVQLGRNPLFQFFSTPEEETLIESVSLAALSLATNRHGAIIVLEREIGLRNYAASGIALDARVSYELLMSLFHPRSPLHDGAVIVCQGRITAAACLLPLTTKPHLSVRYGSRHRAALGLSEETDALIVVVSEERGTIAIARDGEMQALEAKELKSVLDRELGARRQASKKQPRRAAA